MRKTKERTPIASLRLLSNKNEYTVREDTHNDTEDNEIITTKSVGAEPLM